MCAVNHHIYKPEEVDNLIKEGIIDHKDDVIQVQLYVLTYIIHTCNSRCLVPYKYGKLICRTKNYRKSPGRFYTGSTESNLQFSPAYSLGPNISPKNEPSRREGADAPILHQL